MITTLIDRFQYPRLGPGMMWERWADRLARGGVQTVLGADVTGLRHEDGRVVEALVAHRDGRRETIRGGHFISTMPIRDLVRSLAPAAPREVRAAAERLRYRDFLTVVLIVDEPDLFPDNWIYIHSPDVLVGRVQNFKNWSPDMVPDPSRTSLGLEYFVQAGDGLWSTPDDELIALGGREMARLGLLDEGAVLDGVVVRMSNAYPIYDSHYKEALATIREFLSTIGNLHLVGRNGQHRYNNQDHSMMTGIYAARNIAGEAWDVWSVNVDDEYHEEERASRGASAGNGAGRVTPEGLADRTLEELLRAAFARYDPLALGIAIGTVCGVGLFATTVATLLGAAGDPGGLLSLLGQYLVGYRVSWIGSVLGLTGGFAGGYLFGEVLARSINALIGWHEKLLLRELEIAGTLDPLDNEAP